MTALAIDATISKAYGDSPVLVDARLVVRPGTVHAIVGENGAGKSTLLHVIAGLVRAERGALTIAGRAIDLASHDVARARALGVGLVQQHPAAAPQLSVVENAVLGAEPVRHGRLDLGPAAAALAALGARLGLPVDPAARVAALPVAARQRAEIVVALWRGARLLALDEPTALLAPAEIDGLLGVLRRLAATGTTVVLVTHRLDEVAAVADDVTVLRRGATVASYPASTSSAQIATDLIGAPPPAVAARAPRAPGTVVLSLRDVVGGALAGASLAVHAGEVVGVAGITGDGPEALADVIAGLVRITRGRLDLVGVDATRATVAARQRLGLAHVPADRQARGLVLPATVEANVLLARRDLVPGWWRDRRAERAAVTALLADGDVRPGDPTQPAAALSGGNQQKLVVARELGRPALRCVVVAYPTRGVDLGAAARIHDRLRAAAATGAAVLVISADLDELQALSDRLLVMARGKIVGELVGDAVVAADARPQISAWMTGAAA